jgi:hypothetical protein
MLWSWFVADDFRSMARPDVGIAYLALSLEFVGSDKVIPSPRTMPVRIAADTYRMAVIRFDGTRQPGYTSRQRELAVKMIGEIARLAKPRGIQIDFDAPRSAWPFYRELLKEVRARIVPEVFLSITALVTWCGDARSWLAGLPVDEIVPMAFEMGEATPATLTMLARGGEFAYPGCRGSIGVAMPAGGALAVRPRPAQRAYFFASGRKWTAEMVGRAAGR